MCCDQIRSAQIRAVQSRGGLERGLHHAGHGAVLLCENDPLAIEVLRHRFNGVSLHEDVRTLSTLPAETSLVAAGFPCQDLSQAGQTRGIATDGVKWSVIGQFENVARKGDGGPVQSRQAAKKTVNQRDIEEDARRSPAFPLRPFSCTFGTALAGIDGSRSGLVGEAFRLIERHRIDWVLVENVPFMLHLGGGRAMEVIASSFEKLGYSWAYRTVDARAFGLPQRRKRVYFVASRDGDPRTVLFADEADETNEKARATTTVACGFFWTEGIRGLGWAVDATPTLKGGSGLGIPSAPAILLPDGRVVMPDIRDAERLQGFPPDWTLPAEEIAKAGTRWKLVGNAVSVPVSEWLGHRLANPGPVADFGQHRVEGARWPSAAWNVGDGRIAVDASQWPVQRPYQSLEAFLRYEPRLLSGRATRGFLSRTARGRLRFPDGFLEAVDAHRVRMERAESSYPQPRTAPSCVAEPLASLYA